MVWLSTPTGSIQYELYFDIRDVKLAYQDRSVVAVVCGLVGDGVQEDWGEVILGAQDSARILPCWAGSDKIECLTDHVDEQLLQQELIDAAREYLKTADIFSALQSDAQDPQDRSTPESRNKKLAA